MRRAVLEKVRASERSVVVFDIDSTLLSTGPRHHRILSEFANESGDAGLVELVRGLTPASYGWTVDGPLVGTPFDRPELREAVQAFWWERFFHPDYLDVDVPVAGAVDFVNQVHRAGAWVYYLTARHLPQMGPATARTLLEHGFPLQSGRAVLHLKPSRAVKDHAFKATVRRDIAALGTVAATFENDPTNANLFVDAFPDAVNVLLDTVCAPDAPAPHPSLLRIPDFSR